MGKTTVNIPPDINRVINSIKKNRPGSTQTGILMELARLGAEQNILIELIEKTEALDSKIEKIGQETSYVSLEKLLTKIQFGVTHALCIARRFAHKDDSALLKTADNDAAALAKRD